MNTQRLTILRDELVKYSRKPGNLKFDLHSWIQTPQKYWNRDYNIVARAARRGENYCGTAACAVGLACTIPAFRREGLRFESCGPAFKDHEDWQAVTSFFGIDLDDARELFSVYHYVVHDVRDPLAVADKITALLETA